MSDQEKFAATRKSMISAGISALYADPAIKFNQYGDKGLLLSEEAKSGRMREQLGAGRGYFFYGEGSTAIALFQLTCRSAMVKGCTVHVCALPFLAELVCHRESWQEHGPDLSAILAVDVLGVLGFYDRDFPDALTQRERYKLGWLLHERMTAGKAVVMHSDSHPRECMWWSSNLRRLIEERCTIYSV